MPNTVYNRVGVNKVEHGFVEKDFLFMQGIADYFRIEINRLEEIYRGGDAMKIDEVAFIVNPYFGKSFQLPCTIEDGSTIKVDLTQEIADKIRFNHAVYALYVTVEGKKLIFMKGNIKFMKGALIEPSKTDGANDREV